MKGIRLLSKAENIKDYIKKKGIIQAIKCGVCKEAFAFDLEDIEFKQQEGRKLMNDRFEGFVTCPWCGHRVYIGLWFRNGRQMHLCQKYWTTIEE